MKLKTNKDIMVRRTFLKILFLILIMFCITDSLYAKTYTKEYTYQASEADSKNTARENALTQVQSLALKQIGTYIESSFYDTQKESKTGKEQISEQDIVTITAGITRTKILDQKWDGEQFYIKVEMDVDEKDVLKKIEELKAQRDRTKELEDEISKAKEENNNDSKQIKQLREQLDKAIKQADEANNKLTSEQEIKSRAEKAFKEMEQSRENYSQAQAGEEKSRYREEYQSKVNEVAKYSNFNIDTGHVSKLGMGLQYLGLSLKYFSGTFSYEFKYAAGDGVNGSGPRVYLNFNPESDNVFYIGAEYCVINGKTNLQTFTGNSIGCFIGMEIFTYKDVSGQGSIFLDIGPYATTLNSEFSGIGITNSDIVCNLGFNIYTR